MPLTDFVVESLPIPERIYEKPSAPKAKIPRPKKVDLATKNALIFLLRTTKSAYNKDMKKLEGLSYAELPPWRHAIIIAEEFLGRQA